MTAAIELPAEEYLTTEEVADELRVTDRSVRRWCKDGMLIGRRVGRRWLIRQEDVDAALKRGDIG